MRIVSKFLIGAAAVGLFLAGYYIRNPQRTKSDAPFVRDVPVEERSIRTVPPGGSADGDSIDWEAELADVALVDETSCLPEGRAAYCSSLSEAECLLAAAACERKVGSSCPTCLDISYQGCAPYTCRDAAEYDARKVLCERAGALWIDSIEHPYQGTCGCLDETNPTYGQEKQCLEEWQACVADAWKTLDSCRFQSCGVSIETIRDPERCLVKSASCQALMEMEYDSDVRYEFSFYHGQCVLSESYDPRTDTYWLYLNGLREYPE